jgi:hypothetical protein
MAEASEKPKNIHWTEMLEEYFASTGPLFVVVS